MFTGIVEEIGTIKSKQSIKGGFRYTISATRIMKNISIGDSINIDGACQTIVDFSSSEFIVESVGETLEKTTLGNFEKNRKVNLEGALSVGDRLGGHFVQGHVNATGRISQWYPRGENYFLEVEIPENLTYYVILEGSIAIDGISLTIAKLQNSRVGINIIPHTVKNTNLQFKKVGDFVNIEVDMIAKYIEKLIYRNKTDSLNVENLKKWGY